MEHAKGTQGDFGMNQKGTGVYGMDASGDGIVTADELKTHYDALAVADAKHKAATEANDAYLAKVQADMEQAAAAARVGPKDRGTHMSAVGASSRLPSAPLSPSFPSCTPWLHDRPSDPRTRAGAHTCACTRVDTRDKLLADTHTGQLA
jgi:hypothetical protein